MLFFWVAKWTYFWEKKKGVFFPFSLFRGVFSFVVGVGAELVIDICCVWCCLLFFSSGRPNQILIIAYSASHIPDPRKIMTEPNINEKMRLYSALAEKTIASQKVRCIELQDKVELCRILIQSLQFNLSEAQERIILQERASIKRVGMHRDIGMWWKRRVLSSVVRCWYERNC